MSHIPQTQAPAELVLSRAELVYVLHALQTTHIIGVDLREFAWPQEQLDALLKEAERSLIARSLLAIEDQNQTRLLAPELAGMVGALAFRHLAVVLVRGVRSKGQQLFVFNMYRDAMVEHTQPQEDTHRLALIPTLEDLSARIQSLVPLLAVTEEGRPELTLAQAEFERLQQEIQANDSGESVVALHDAGLSNELATALVQALRNPLFTLSLAFLKCEQDTVVDARSAAIFADEQSAWGAWSNTGDTGVPQVIVFPTGINDVWSAMVDWFREGEGNSA